MRYVKVRGITEGVEYVPMSMKNGTSKRIVFPKGRNRLYQHSCRLYNVSMFLKNFAILGKVRLDQRIRKISYSIKYLFQNEHSTFLKTSHWGLYYISSLCLLRVLRVLGNEG